MFQIRRFGESISNNDNILITSLCYLLLHLFIWWDDRDIFLREGEDASAGFTRSWCGAGPEGLQIGKQMRVVVARATLRVVAVYLLGPQQSGLSSRFNLG